MKRKVIYLLQLVLLCYLNCIPSRCAEFKMNFASGKGASSILQELSGVNTLFFCFVECFMMKNEQCKSISYCNIGKKCLLHNNHSQVLQIQSNEGCKVYDKTVKILTPGIKRSTIVLRNIFKNEILFNKPYTIYENGFGNVSSGNYFVGLKNLNKMTTSNSMGARFEVLNTNNVLLWEEWNSIKIGNASDGYRLQMSARNASSTLGNGNNNGMTQQLNMKFSAYDMDQDLSTDAHCASNNGGVGWWFSNCNTFYLTSSQNTYAYGSGSEDIQHFLKTAMYLIG